MEKTIWGIGFGFRVNVVPSLRLWRYLLDESKPEGVKAVDAELFWRRLNGKLGLSEAKGCGG